MTTTEIAPIDEVRNSLARMKPELKKALPPHVSVEKFERVTMTALQTNPDLLTADRRTLFGAVTRAAQTGLLPDGREGAIVMFSGKAQWMPMVAGVMKLVRNSGEISTWSVQAVYENDDFDYQLGDNEHIVHKPAKRNRGPFIGAYSIVTMKDGEKSREYMDIDQIEAIRKRSRSGNAGPWKSDFDEMAKKTVIRRHSKRLPMSTDLDAVMHEDDELFHAPEPAAQQAPAEAPVQQAAPQRSSRLHAAMSDVIDADGVIVEHEPQQTTPAQDMPDDDNSPI